MTQDRCAERDDKPKIDVSINIYTHLLVVELILSPPSAEHGLAGE